VAYLDDGYDQYADWSKSGGGDETFSHQAETPWLAELLRSERGMPKRYGCALNRSKGKIRSYVYGGRIDKGEHSGVAMSGQNKTLVRRFVQELLNAKNLAATDELLADDFVVHLPGAASIKGREAFKERL
jgi:hypothetical protein